MVKKRGKGKRRGEGKATGGKKKVKRVKVYMKMIQQHHSRKNY